MKKRHNIKAIHKAIQLAGGAPKLAKLIDVTYQSVILWKNGHFSPNPLNCVKIEKAVNGGVKREEILPHYPWDEMS